MFTALCFSQPRLEGCGCNHDAFTLLDKTQLIGRISLERQRQNEEIMRGVELTNPPHIIFKILFSVARQLQAKDGLPTEPVKNYLLDRTICPTFASTNEGIPERKSHKTFHFEQTLVFKPHLYLLTAAVVI